MAMPAKRDIPLEGCYQCMSLLNRVWKENLTQCSNTKSDCGNAITDERINHDIRVPLGGKVVLNCSFKGLDNCVWSRNKDVVIVDGRYSYVDGKNGKQTDNCSISIDSIKMIDFGKWDCGALKASSHLAVPIASIKLLQLATGRAEVTPAGVTESHAATARAEVPFTEVTKLPDTTTTVTPEDLTPKATEPPEKITTVLIIGIVVGGVILVSLILMTGIACICLRNAKKCGMTENINENAPFLTTRPNLSTMTEMGSMPIIHRTTQLTRTGTPAANMGNASVIMRSNRIRSAITNEDAEGYLMPISNAVASASQDKAFGAGMSWRKKNNDDDPKHFYHEIPEQHVYYEIPEEP